MRDHDGLHAGSLKPTQAIPDKHVGESSRARACECGAFPDMINPIDLIDQPTQALVG